MESGQKPKPKFKASLTTPKPQSPTKHNQQQQAFSFDQQENAFINDALLALDEANNGGDNSNINKQKYFDSLPPGYRFRPYDEELIVYYLMKKVANEKLPINKIRDVNLYKHNPSQLAESFPTGGENEWYFFTPRSRKYRKGKRPNRAAGDGYWKATGADNVISHNGDIVGYRKALVFYKGKPPKGDKTKWIMHEFRVKSEDPIDKKGTDDMRLDAWVLCKMYQKTRKGKGAEGCSSSNSNEETEESDPKAPTPPSVPSSPFLNVNAVAEMTYNYNPAGGSNGFMGNSLVNHPQMNSLVNYPQMPYHNNPLVPAEMPQYVDESRIPNCARFNAYLHQPMSFNYVPALPISSFKPPPSPPPLHPAEKSVMPMPTPKPDQYMKVDMALDHSPRLVGPVEDDYLWASSFDGYDLPYPFGLANFGHPNYMEDFQDLHNDGSYNPPTDPNLPEEGSYNPQTNPSSF